MNTMHMYNNAANNPEMIYNMVIATIIGSSITMFSQNIPKIIESILAFFVLIFQFVFNKMKKEPLSKITIFIK
jgi:hypothetical protein